MGLEYEWDTMGYIIYNYVYFFSALGFVIS